MNKLIFVCSPYSGDIERNVQFAKECCLKVIQEGDIPFAPHLYFTQFLDDSVAEQRRYGMRCGLRIMRMCDEVYTFRKYGVSNGMRNEIATAKTIGMKVIYR